MAFCRNDVLSPIDVPTLITSDGSENIQIYEIALSQGFDMFPTVCTTYFQSHLTCFLKCNHI